MNELVTRKRHGFVTFFLWTMILAFSLMAFLYFSNLKYCIDRISIIDFCGMGIYYTFCIISSVLLLKWKKIGFWCYVGSSVIAIIFLLVVEGYYRFHFHDDFPYIWSTNPTIQITAVSIAVLWIILQIKKGGISCWKNLK